MTAAAQTGFYGKFFTHGDFVSRRLPRDFIDKWHGWVVDGMIVSQGQLGDKWLEFYLHSPIWRFGLSTGLCGNSTWAGVVMPSIDKVGRHFPLTLAAPLKAADQLPTLFDTQQGHDWFSELEKLALTCLSDGFDLDGFDFELQSIKPPVFEAEKNEQETNGNVTVPLGFQESFSALKKGSSGLIEANCTLSEYTQSAYSLWWTTSKEICSSPVILDGMPAAEDFVFLISGSLYCSGMNPSY